MSLTILIYVLLGALIIQLFEIIYLVVLYKNKSKEVHSLKADATKEQQKIISAAQKKAEEIVQNAVDASESILYETESFKNKVEKELKFALQDVSEKRKKDFDALLSDTFKEFKDQFTQLRSTYQTQTDVTSKEMIAFVKAELDVLKEESQSKSQFVQQFMTDKLNAEFEKIQKELSVYKEQQMLAFQQQVKERVNEVSRTVLQGSISQEKQDELLMAALEKARKESIL